jgi:hypothetical protein
MHVVHVRATHLAASAAIACPLLSWRGLERRRPERSKGPADAAGRTKLGLQRLAKTGCCILHGGIATG